MSLLYRIFENPTLNLETHGGALLWDDAVGSEWGVEFGIRADAMPLRPLVLHAGASVGRLGAATVHRFSRGGVAALGTAG